MGTPPQSIFKKKDVQYTINWFKKYRTNISLGEEDLFSKISRSNIKAWNKNKSVLVKIWRSSASKNQEDMMKRDTKW